MPRDMSFLPEDYVERRLQRRTNFISLSLFVVVMSAVVGAYLVTDRQRAEVVKQQKQVNTEFADAAKRLEQLELLQQRKRQMVHKAQVTAALLERVPRSLVLSELVNNMPQTLSLMELNLESKVVRRSSGASTTLEQAKQKARARAEGTLAEPDVPTAEVLVQLVGMALTDVEIAQLMAALGRCPLFRDVNLVFSEQLAVKERTLRRFRVDLAINQSVDLRKFNPTMVKRDLKMNPMSDTLELVIPEGAVPPPRPRPDLRHVAD